MFTVISTDIFAHRTPFVYCRRSSMTGVSLVMRSQKSL
ncbi:hypothetical protein VPHD235_0154 [Vibrio phage D235]